jgi:hypothetical protein
MKAFGAILLTLGLMSGGCWAGSRIRYAIKFNQQCSGHLKLAADANSIALAEQELGKAVSFLEEKKITEGYTTLFSFLRIPKDDVSFWYQNLKGSLENLRQAKNSTQLEQTNVLMKLRETLLDHTSAGDSITRPGGIEIFPNNIEWAWWGGISALFILMGGFVICWWETGGSWVEIMVVIGIIGLLTFILLGGVIL